MHMVNVRTALHHSGLAATSLIIEVSETDLMRNIQATAARLQALHELGVRIAVDDFGTGYFSLAYLQQCSVDSLKIDRAFTNAAAADPDAAPECPVGIRLTSLSHHRAHCLGAAVRGTARPCPCSPDDAVGRARARWLGWLRADPLVSVRSGGLAPAGDNQCRQPDQQYGEADAGLGDE